MSNSTRPSSAPPATSGGYDERFVIPLEASRRGAHRARVSPLMAALPVVAVAAIVVGAIALVAMFLGGTGGSNAGANATTAVTPTPSAAATGSPSAAASSQPSESASPTDVAPAGDVDKTIQLAVYNNTSTNGLAKKVAGKLTAAGWNVGSSASWTGASVAATTVYYGKEDQRATAQALAKAVGHAMIKLSASKAGTGMAVVIASDYAGAGSPAGAVGASTRASSSSHSSKPAPSSSRTAKTSPPAGETSSAPAAGGESPSPSQ